MSADTQTTFLGMPPFPEAAVHALADEQLRANLHRATSTIRAKRAGVVGEVPDWSELRDAGSAIKETVMAHLPELLERVLGDRHVTGLAWRAAGDDGQTASPRVLDCDALGLGFGAWVWWYLGQEAGMAYLTGFAVEKALALDNVFVISVIFAALAIPRALQHRVLFWGILGVIVLRGLMIGLGCAITIVICAAVWLFDRAATRLALVLERTGERLFRRRRAVHAGSGMMRKAKAPKSAPL